MIPMKKLLNKKGFTLMEMLIVVAIIVILVAISVPTFTANLGEAKAATDAANLRAAKSAAQIYVINNDVTTTDTYYYDAEGGDVSTTEPTEGYGECSNHVKSGSETKDAYITITYDADGKATVEWSDGDDCAE